MKTPILAIALSIVFSTSIQAEQRNLCEQAISFDAPTASPEIPINIKQWQGVWVGSLGDYGAFCTGLIVGNINADGAVSVKYIHGRSERYRLAQPETQDLTAKISGNTLTLTTKGGATIVYSLKSESQLSIIFSGRGGDIKGNLAKQ